MDNDSSPDPPQPADHPKPTGFSAFWQELKRRHVVRVGTVYAVVAWLIIQIAATTFEGFGIPDWAFRFVVLMVLLGFPVSLIIAWAFELTPEGIKTTKVAQQVKKDSPTADEFTNKRKWLTLAFGAAIPTLIFGTLALYFYFRSDTVPSSNQFTELDKSIAVLPLTNMSPDPENAFFADGVHEDVLTNLSKIKELHVIGRTSTLQYRDTVKTLQQIGEELNVRYLLEGSVRRARDRVLVTVQLIDARTEGHIWAENYSRELDDIFAIQASIAKDVAGRLQAVISPEEIVQIERRLTKNQEAYDYYVKARQLIETAGPDGGEAKITALEQSVALDPNFAEAWALLANESMFWWGRIRGIREKDADEVLAKAHAALKEAEKLAPDSPDVLFAKTEFLLLEEEDTEGAIRLLLRILSMDPNHFYAQFQLGRQYLGMRRYSEAAYYFESMLRTDPLSRRVNTFLLRTYQRLRSWDKANELTRKNVARGGELEDYWLERKVATEYFQTGDKNALLEGIGQIPGYLDSPKTQCEMALISRDYDRALNSLSEMDPSNTSLDFGIFSDLAISPRELAKALVHFERSDRTAWMTEAEKARLKLAESSARPNASVNQWAKLAICHGLMGDRERAMSLLSEGRAKKPSSLNQMTEFEVMSAIVFLVLGNHDKAIQILEAASKMDGPLFVSRELDLWFIFDRLRGNPRFDALLKD
ncbi:MAG: hypothetical protein O3C43_10040 [Verrucomicrobia bacterium]|nr:hypothetical protein [Verrucomicrobiota bacterium]MDA1066832.1 hypothetical protein [Verrucomicrobiota bacterium]